MFLQIIGFLVMFCGGLWLLVQSFQWAFAWYAFHGKFSLPPIILMVVAAVLIGLALYNAPFIVSFSLGVKP